VPVSRYSVMLSRMLSRVSRPTGRSSTNARGSCRSSLTWADIDATAAYAQGREAARWLETRRGRSGLVVWADGTTTTVAPVLPV
jgi:hypothetical protein